jgi:CRP-like cAMP-binding protein
MRNVPHRSTCEIRLTGILSARDLSGFGSIGSSQRMRFEPGEVVIERGKSPAGVFLLLNGQATLTGRSGRRLAIDAARSDAAPVFGMTECLAGSVSDMCLTAKTSCELAHIDEEDLIRLLLERPDICLRVAAAVGRSYAMAVHAIKDH